MKKLENFFRDESGAVAVEYGLLVTLIAVAIVGVLTTVGATLSGQFNAVTIPIEAGK